MSSDSAKVDKDNKLIRAIFSDHDETLCSASAVRDGRIGQSRVSFEIRETLQQISPQILAQITACTACAGEDVLYIGDSENDNPTFRKAGVAIRVHFDSRLKTKLDCQYYIDFESLASFLKKLQDNSFIFSERLLQ